MEGIATLGDQAPATETLVALLGGALAASTHFTKSGTRVLANASPEPFSNWFLSLGEDAFVVTLGLVALKYPVIALGIVAVGLLVIALFATVLVRAIRRRWSRRGGLPIHDSA